MLRREGEGTYLGKITRACIILHNMIVEIGKIMRSCIKPKFPCEFHVFDDIPSNLGNMMSIRNRVRDKTIHQQLKADLVEHIWQKFGTNQNFD